MTQGLHLQEILSSERQNCKIRDIQIDLQDQKVSILQGVQQVSEFEAILGSESGGLKSCRSMLLQMERSSDKLTLLLKRHCNSNPSLSACHACCANDRNSCFASYVERLRLYLTAIGGPIPS